MAHTSADIEKFVTCAGSSNSAPDEQNLAILLNSAPLLDVQAYWGRFVGDSARRAANAVPDWRSKEQLAELKGEHIRLSYDIHAPSASEAGFRAHVLHSLLDHIREEQRAREAFRQLPWIQRWHVNLMFVFIVLLWLCVLAAIPAFLLDLVFKVGILKRIGPIAEDAVVILWSVILACIPVIAGWKAIRSRIRQRGS